LYLLGLDTFLRYGNEYYLKKGADFFIVFGITAGQMLLPVAVVLICGLLLVIMIKRYVKISILEKAIKRVFDLHKEKPALWKGAFLFIAFFLLFYPLINDLEYFWAPLKINNLLFVNTNLSDAHFSVKMGMIDESEKIRFWLINDQKKYLKGRFEELLGRFFLAAILLFVTSRITPGWKYRPLIIFPFGFVLFLYVILLLQNSGVLLKRIEFHPIKLFESSGGAISQPQTKMFLLNSTDQEYILWDQCSQKVIWLRKERVIKVEIEKRESLFKTVIGENISPGEMKRSQYSGE